MPLFVQRWIEKHTFFEFQLEQRRKDLYYFLIRRLMHEWQRYSSNFQFENLNKIIVLREPDSELQAAGAGGISGPDYVKVCYFDVPRYDSVTLSHELMHWLLGHFVLRGDLQAHRDSNNLVHYATNKGYPYQFSRWHRRLRWQDFLSGRKAELVEVFYLDLGLLIGHRDRIKSEIIAGTAPRGKDKYWTY
jgi:hypothetical protein